MAVMILYRARPPYCFFVHNSLSCFISEFVIILIIRLLLYSKSIHIKISGSLRANVNIWCDIQTHTHISINMIAISSAFYRAYKIGFSSSGKLETFLRFNYAYIIHDMHINNIGIYSH